ncbi:hypothetical protein BDK51DRAFT_45775 [Blyttiomyces helicus]|uniref:Uncharacterized protein n=1 Tax=Blyttiomyces helicus TaxID=388810 RepID=A0A4P9W9G9_9FUNG|nr:hypothetical protein BDK51DRAFT_45775 [Blyttiomyces helicus]|eukprot:RKO89199.1 hypothetical protein BDK51DRAFT_45775 [Blyttiomyces helicus]
MSLPDTSRITDALEKTTYPACDHQPSPLLDSVISKNDQTTAINCLLDQKAAYSVAVAQWNVQHVTFQQHRIPPRQYYQEYQHQSRQQQQQRYRATPTRCRKNVQNGTSHTHNHNINIRDIDQRLCSLEKTIDNGANRTNRHIRNVNDNLHVTMHRNVIALNRRIDALHSLHFNDQQRIDLLEKSLRHLRHQKAALNNIIDSLHMDIAKYASFNEIVSDVSARRLCFAHLHLLIRTTKCNTSNLISVDTPTIFPRVGFFRDRHASVYVKQGHIEFLKRILGEKFPVVYLDQECRFGVAPFSLKMRSPSPVTTMSTISHDS